MLMLERASRSQCWRAASLTSPAPDAVGGRWKAPLLTAIGAWDDGDEGGERDERVATDRRTEDEALDRRVPALRTFHSSRSSSCARPAVLRSGISLGTSMLGSGITIERAGETRAALPWSSQAGEERERLRVGEGVGSEARRDWTVKAGVARKMLAGELA